MFRTLLLLCFAIKDINSEVGQLLVGGAGQKFTELLNYAARPRNMKKYEAAQNLQLLENVKS